MNIFKKWLIVITIFISTVIIIVGLWYSMKLKKGKKLKKVFKNIKNLNDIFSRHTIRTPTTSINQW